MAGARNGPKAVISNSNSPNLIIYSYTCADGNALSKGTLVEAWDPYTASMANAWTTGSLTTSGAFLGVVWRDKEANDGATQVAVLKEGKADMRCSGAVTLGAAVYCAGNDEVKMLSQAQVSQAIATSGFLNSMMVGIAEEAGSDTEVIVVRFNK